MGSGLPPQLQSLRSFLPHLVAEARKRAPYASALVTQQAGLLVTKSRTEEKVIPTPPDPGIRITVWDGATFRSVATNRLASPDHLMELTRELAGSIAVRNGPTPEAQAPLDRHFRTGCPEAPLSPDSAARLCFASRIHASVAGRDDRIVSAQVSCTTDIEYRLFCDGPRLLSSEVIHTALCAQAIASDRNRQVATYDVRSGAGWEAVSSADDDWAQGVADEALAGLEAVPLEPGERTCILAPDVAGLLAHESFGHGCELDTMMRGAARALGYVGRRVGSDLVTIVDEPGRAGVGGAIFFSDDGVLAEGPVVLVQDGILQPTMLCDRYSYLMMRDRLPGLRQSASGRVESWSHPVYARMTHTYFVPRRPEQGGKTRDEMIEATEHGVLLEKAASGMEDPLGWGVQLQALHGREIRSGRLTGRRHYPVGITGYVPDVLASVDAVGTELGTGFTGICGKGHKEWVRSSCSGPYLRCRLILG